MSGSSTRRGGASRRKRGRAARRSRLLQGENEASDVGADARTDAPPAGPEDLREGQWPVSTGEVALERDPYTPDTWTVLVNGVPSSSINLSDPLHLDFEYMRWMALILGNVFDAEARLRVLHLGGGAAAFPRYVNAAFPKSRQVVVEFDARLNELVRGWFDLPRAPMLRLRSGDALDVVPTLTAASRDVVVRDVFAGDATPSGFVDAGFVGEVARVLAPDGLYLLNVGDGPELVNVRRELSTLKGTFGNIIAVSDPAVFKGRRRGNIVMAASNQGFGDAARLVKGLLSDPLPAQVLAGNELESRFGAK